MLTTPREPQGGEESDASDARMSVAMALAEATHHNAPRGQRIVRARGEGRDEMNFDSFLIESIA